MRVRTGLQRLLDGDGPDLGGLKLGLLANPTSVDVEMRHSIDLLRACGSAPPAELALDPRMPPPSRRGGVWRCWFPLEAVRRGVGAATVILRVRVGPDGRVHGVQTIRDPGAGFGRVAAACATIRPYDPTIDAHGRPVEATTPPIRMHFLR